jgi:hypothetical protein
LFVLVARLTFFTYFSAAIFPAVKPIQILFDRPWNLHSCERKKEKKTFRYYVTKKKLFPTQQYILLYILYILYICIIFVWRFYKFVSAMIVQVF